MLLPIVKHGKRIPFQHINV